jgi:hypothetical protein
MTTSFTWVAWDVKARGVRPETRVHNNREINRRRKLARAGTRKNLEVSFEGHLVQSELTRTDVDRGVELGLTVNRQAFDHHPLVYPPVPLKHQRSVSKRDVPPQSVNLLTTLSKPGNSISPGSYFPPTKWSLAPADVPHSSSQSNRVLGAARYSTSQNIVHASHNTNLPSTLTPGLNKTISESELGLQSHEGEALSPTLRSASCTPPQDYLTSLRRDNLNALPVDLDQDQILVDYWFAEMPRILHLDGNPSIGKMLSSGSNLLFSAALSSSEAFQSTILLWAIHHRARVHGIKYSPQAMRLRSSLARWSMEITNPSNWNGERLGETGLALLSSANAECLYGDQSTALQFYDHSRSWFRRWRLSGSMWTSYHDVALKMLFWWYRVLNAGSVCCTRNYVVSDGNLFAHKQLEEDFETFWSFIGRARELAMQQCLMTAGSTTVRRRTLFKRGSFFRNLLELRPSLSGSIQRRRQIYCQFLVLSFIHGALLELKDSFEETETYLAKLLQQAAEMDLTSDAFPIYSLLWLYQKDPILSYSAVVAQISAASQIALRLTDLGLSILNSVLMAYLELDDEPAGIVNLPHLEKTLFYGMVFSQDDWKFTESMEDTMFMPIR